jgi:hypothetical protein
MLGENDGSLPRREERRESEVTDVGTLASREGGRPPQYPESRERGRVELASEPCRPDELDTLRCRGESEKLDSADDDGERKLAFGLDSIGLDVCGLVAVRTPRAVVAAAARPPAAGKAVPRAGSAGAGPSLGAVSSADGCARAAFKPWYICWGALGSTGALGVTGVIGVVGVGGMPGAGCACACDIMLGRDWAEGIDGDVGCECDWGAGVVFSIPLDGGGEAERLRGRWGTGAATTEDVVAGCTAARGVVGSSGRSGSSRSRGYVWELPLPRGVGPALELAPGVDPELEDPAGAAERGWWGGGGGGG